MYEYSGNLFTLLKTYLLVQENLLLEPATHVYLYALLSPVGPYFPSGMKPVTLYADTHYVRAWPGGTGGYKVGACALTSFKFD